MKLLTLNTHSWLEADALEKMDEIAQMIASQSFDVIALQEVNQSVNAPTVHSPFHFSPNSQGHPIRQDNFALQLVQKLEFDYHCTYYWTYAYNHIAYDHYEEGVVLLSKTPFQNVMVYPLSKITDPNDYHTRVLVGAEIKIQNQSFDFYSLHASWWVSPEGFSCFPYEVEKLKEVQQNTSHPVFLMGDFNNPSHIQGEGYSALQKDWWDSYSLAKETCGKYTVMNNIAGWDDNQGGLRIDFIMMSQKFPISLTKVYFDGKNGKIVSDHFGYGVDLLLTNMDKRKDAKI